MFTRCLLHLLLILAVHSPAFSQESPSEPEPANLKSGWWGYFDVSGEDLRTRIKTYDADLRDLTKDLSIENREAAEASIQQITNYLNTYANIRSQPPVKPPTPRPYLKSYSIDNILELHGQVRKERIELKTLQEELKKEEQKRAASQSLFDQLMIEYYASEERSEEKLLIGLTVLAERVNLEVIKKNVEVLEQKVANLTEEVENNSDEIAHAIRNLVSTPEEEARFAREITSTKVVWKDVKSELQRTEDIRTKEFSGEPGQQNEVKNQYLTLQVVEASIKEKIAHINYIQTEMFFQLSRLLNAPQDVDLVNFLGYLQGWEETIADFKEQSASWEELTRRSMQQAVELLSLNGQASADKFTLDEIIRIGQQNILQLQRFNSEIDDTLFLTNVIDKEIIQFKGIGERWYREVLSFFAGIIFAIVEFGGQTLFYIGQNPVTPLSILQFILIMVGTIWGARIIVRTLLSVTHKRKGIRKGVVYRLSRLIYYFTLFIGLIIALTFLGFNLTNIFLIAGALGVGIGFGLQTIFNNFISGIIILFQSNLRVGDYVEFESGIKGEIREINVSSTMVTTNDGIEVLVPNSEMISRRVINWTLRDPYRRVQVSFGVAYGTDIDEMARIVVEAAKKVPSTLQKIGVPEPIVYMKEFGDSSLNFKLVVWVNEKFTRRTSKTQSEYLWAIEKALKKTGIKVPYPQRDVHIIPPRK